MSEPAAQRSSREPVEAPSGSWPHALGQQPTLRVGDVLAALRPEFPSLSPSKLRFLDAQGLVSPERTPSGYRHYSAAHIERLRFVLRQQRDAYAPLGIIRERLADLDAGRAYEPVSLAVAADDEGTVSIAQAAAVAGTSGDLVAQLVAEGLVEPTEPGRLARSSVALVAACARYVESGADVREARALVRAARREAEAAAHASAPLRRRDDDMAARLQSAARREAAAALFGAAIASAPHDSA